ncbi:CopG family transcriptional regulator [Psychrobacter sp. HD31]|uniref:CopG family transcriptional regulator n=1 Tax=Psychrobacter sp. HD31 TaxID=3112003 RepID=UPI003DA1F9BC
MIPVRVRNKFYKTPQKIMRPVHFKLSEEMIALLTETAHEHGFNKIQGLMRLYIREGLDRDNDKYRIEHDEVFLQQLRDKGVSESIIEQAIIDANNVCRNQN